MSELLPFDLDKLRFNLRQQYASEIESYMDREGFALEVFHTAFIPKRCRSGTVVYKRLTRDEDGHVVQLSDPQISDLLDYRPGQLKRVIPPQLGFLTHLKVLNLNSSGIRGEIPSTIGDLRCLQHLTLGHNMLTGTIPVTLSNLGELRTLDLGNNCLTGSFDMICELGHLTAAYLLHNRLSGVLPPLLKMPSLNRLALQYNSFTGPFPNELPDTIEMLQLSHNNLTDFDGVVLPSSLRWLYLDHNSFTPDTKYEEWKIAMKQNNASVHISFS